MWKLETFYVLAKLSGFLQLCVLDILGKLFICTGVPCGFHFKDYWLHTQFQKLSCSFEIGQAEILNNNNGKFWAF